MKKVLLFIVVAFLLLGALIPSVHSARHKEDIQKIRSLLELIEERLADKEKQALERIQNTQEDLGQAESDLDDLETKYANKKEEVAELLEDLSHAKWLHEQIVASHAQQRNLIEVIRNKVKELRNVKSE